MALKPGEKIGLTLSSAEPYDADIGNWMKSNMLRSNQHKT